MTGISQGANPPAFGHGPDIVAGIGLRDRATVLDILSLIDACLAQQGRARSDLAALASLERKAAHPAMRAAASELHVPLIGLDEADIAIAVPNPSETVSRLLGHASLAEAAALAFGPLILEKTRSANVTCALSRCLPGYAGVSSRASSAAAMLSTSSAGP